MSSDQPDTAAAPYYQDDLVTLYHGDCREQTTWLAADVLVTDPPYGVAWKSGQFSRAKVPIEEVIAGDLNASARDTVLTLWGDRPALVFGSWRSVRDSPASLNRTSSSRAISAMVPLARLLVWGIRRLSRSA